MHMRKALVHHDQKGGVLLDEQVAIVTGGASGIGKAIAALLCADGASVHVIDRDEDALGAAVRDLKRLGGSCTAHGFDLRNHSQIADLITRIHAQSGRVNILVNSAAVIDSGRTLLDIDVESWDLVHDVNLKAPLLLMQAAAKRMVAGGQGGRIVNVTSSSAFRAVMAYPGYASSKAALTQLTRTAASELGPYNINVNCVAPGITVTPLLDGINGLEGAQRLSESGPLANLLQRPSMPDDVAEVVRFLCLPGSRQITGQTIHTSAGAVV
ncbi:SDR family NAD(P)-dependent oxidoreductase [Hydrogenophaga sp. BPS33]|uniref:SDR family NAD(P)-dependent oxidoreductase n=1 Tax=Hydrogenophaga sp. BPS33 TaxID=2651974 RepID=UPI00131F834D|nr:SDR family oxidoreductase [Hydrogenophaga sp. BPS33]QHE84871.1 SDR family oxidoreductase [Hydrogenophaga sp. BPS33]